jgi:hypothetical protein
MPGPAVTAFAETAALYAVLNEDWPEAHRLVNDMLPGERATLQGQLYKLADLLGARCEGCDALTPIGTSVTVNPLSVDRKYLCKTCADKARAAAECPSCTAPAVGTTIPEHRTGCPFTTDYRPA